MHRESRAPSFRHTDSVSPGVQIITVISIHFPSLPCYFLPLFFFFVKYVSKVSYLFLGAYAKLRKATISFVMSVRSSISPREITWLPLDGFLLNFVFEYFSKISQQNSSLIKF